MKKTCLILLVSILIYACEPDNTTTGQQNQNQNQNFYALTVENSWEYTYYLKDMTTTDFVATSVTETVDITETIEIDNELYYNFKHIVTGNNGSYPMLPSDGERNYTLRDSLGYLIDETGGVKYNNSNYNEHFVDHLDFNYTYHLALSDTEDVITTNAGSFTCYNNHYYFKDVNNNVANALDHIYREDGKGEILSTMSYVSENEHFAEKRLEFYSIQ